MLDSLARDLEAVARLEAVPTILRTIRESTGLRYTLVARVLPDRWIACAVHDEIEFGLKAGGELDVTTTLCSEVRDTGRAIVIDHASHDPIYRTHHTPKMYGFESYIAVPIVRQNGEYFGTLCGLDPEPRKLTDGKTLAMLELFGQLISLQLEAEERYEGDHLELLDQREAAKLREEFIAVLGHDMRNPLGSISIGTELLSRKLTESNDLRTVDRIRSSTRRIGALVEDLLDLARGRLGGGIALDTADVEDLPVRLRHVVAEVQASHPSRKLELSIELNSSVRCDEKRIEQLLSNLIANAIEHGEPHSPVVVRVHGTERTFEIDVRNEGAIADEDIERLFQPYFRGKGGRRNGLGLGLYIVSEIARSHGGRVKVESVNGRTAFTFTMPR
ncbi:MAG TPA: GAF domain-containing sensor histidine kinase [Polyangiaceae bacterium]|jgi:hypothetical protein|nr:GAF domain-containing sensor histidine kinase [Polyangiaceae bacterium]